MSILELGCGDGALWAQNISSLPGEVSVTLSDLSSGMLRDARRAIGRKDSRFPSRHLTVQEFLMKTEALIWSLQTMCFLL